MATPEEVDLSKLPASLRYTRNPATGNSIAEDAQLGFGAARPGLIKKGAKGGLTPTESAIVAQGANFGDVAPINIKTDVPEPALGVRPATTPQIEPSGLPKTDIPQPLPDPDYEMRMGVRNRSITAGDMAPGTGVVFGNRTGKVTRLGQSNIEPALGVANGNNPVQPQATNLSFGGLEASSPVHLVTDPAYGVRPQNKYQLAAQQELQTANTLLNRPAERSIADDGTILTEGANAVGANIVARGAINRAKTLSGIGNDQSQIAIAQQNADTGAFGVNSQAQDRLGTGAREDAIGAVNVAGKTIENEAAGRINSLQAAYHAETDPVKRDAIASELTALTGKTTDKFTPVMGKDDFGSPIYLGAFDNRKGTLNNNTQGNSQVAINAAPASAVAYLKANPNQKAAFKAKYGYLPPGFL